MSRIRAPVAPSAQRWIGGDITGHRATSPPRRRISRRSADAAGLSSVTPWANPGRG